MSTTLPRMANSLKSLSIVIFRRCYEGGCSALPVTVRRGSEDRAAWYGHRPMYGERRERQAFLRGQASPSRSLTRFCPCKAAAASAMRTPGAVTTFWPRLADFPRTSRVVVSRRCKEGGTAVPCPGPSAPGAEKPVAAKGQCRWEQAPRPSGRCLRRAAASHQRVCRVRCYGKRPAA